MFPSARLHVNAAVATQCWRDLDAYLEHRGGGGGDSGGGGTTDIGGTGCRPERPATCGGTRQRSPRRPSGTMVSIISFRGYTFCTAKGHPELTLARTPCVFSCSHLGLSRILLPALSPSRLPKKRTARSVSIPLRFRGRLDNRSGRSDTFARSRATSPASKPCCACI